MVLLSETNTVEPSSQREDKYFVIRLKELSGVVRIILQFRIRRRGRRKSGWKPLIIKASCDEKEETRELIFCSTQVRFTWNNYKADFRNIANTLTSAGRTPSILEACPRVSGKIRLSFSFDSRDRFGSIL